MNLITGHQGIAHVTSQQQRDIYAGIFGNKDVVLDIGSKMSFSRPDSNTVRINDGIAVFGGGCAACIDSGDYEDLTIENGTIGEKRIDLICIHYFINHSLDGSENKEETELVVVKGESSEDTPAIPSLSAISYVDDKFVHMSVIRDGIFNYYFPLYQIELDGIEIIDIKQLFTININTFYDTGWKVASLEENFDNYHTGEINQLKYRQIGSLVEIRGILKPTANLEMEDHLSSYTMACVPTNYAPTTALRREIPGSTTTIWTLELSTLGELKVTRHQKNGVITNLNAGEWLPINISYFLD